MIFKLESLEEIYKDEVSKKILEETKEVQEKNPTNSDWEKGLVEKVYKRTKLIDNTDLAHINSLQNLRHLCAHPVLNKENKLYTPNKETVASNIRNMLESLFLKPPVLSKKILSTILEDIESKKDILIDEASAELYINSKYLHNLNPTIELSIFRELWKIVFKLNDKRCNENRAINYRLLYLLYKRNTSACIEKIKGELPFFSNIENESSQLNFFIRFLSENEFLFETFQADAQLLVQNHVKKDKDAKCVAWFLSESFKKHIQVVKDLHKTYFDVPLQKDIIISAMQRILFVGKTKGYLNECVDLIIWRYKKAQNYSDADKVFEYYVKTYLYDFNKEQLIHLCDSIKNNGQVCDRKRAEEDHKFLLDICTKTIGTKFNSADYPRLFK